MPATATTITFDEAGAAPSLFGNAEPLTDAYASEGITFSGGWEILDQDGNFGLDALSGRNFLAFNTLVAGVTNELTVMFDAPVSSVGGQLGSRDVISWTIEAFLGDVAAGSTGVTNASNEYTPFSLTGSFDRVTILADRPNGVLDDLTFGDPDVGPDPDVVPLPATLPLLLVALGGAGLLSRRRKRH
ncbi:PEP-CTERM sorting domain-containing protein [Roseobacter ponti]|uniref:Ice-binding protein C-terminal domain-containing protein n=1 Tax=Roseobacter ponti TaxID=1891787 RepID=A0A858SVJ1_9RHOB|nr:PEP-CTERM sorting domain-containing protein [Roseobacter ponti]QJF52754.1 hypothetical protein G3256_17025 [Roseobacter ponti]